MEADASAWEKMKRFPVPEFVWMQYELDQKINDRGIAIDMTLVRQAIACDKKFREKYGMTPNEYREASKLNGL